MRKRNLNIINAGTSFKWYGYIVTDLVEFEDVPLSIGYQAQISAISFNAPDLTLS